MESQPAFRGWQRQKDAAQIASKRHCCRITGAPRSGKCLHEYSRSTIAPRSRRSCASITRRQGRLNPIRSRQASQRFLRGATFAAPVAKCTYNEQIPVFDALPLQYVRSSTPDGRPVGP
jgi:hypothetical protein